MNCPLCGGEAVVLHTRQRRGYIARRHGCCYCRTRFNSHQHLVWGGALRVPGRVAKDPSKKRYYP